MTYAGVTQSQVAGILKELYDDQKVQWLTYKDNPFLAMIHKEEKFPGKYYPVPVVYSLSQGASSTFATAYANQSSTGVAEFLVTRVADFSLATIDGQLLAAAQTDPGAFIDGSELMDRFCMADCGQPFGGCVMFRNGAGTLAQIGSLTHVSGSGPYVTTVGLLNPDDAVQFEVNQVLVSVQNQDGTGTAPTDVATITAVDRNAGNLTITSATDESSTWTVNYWLATQGDLPTTTNANFQPSGSTATNKLLRIAGLAAWIPVRCTD